MTSPRLHIGNDILKSLSYRKRHCASSVFRFHDTVTASGTF